MTAVAYIGGESGTGSEASLRLSYLLLVWVLGNALSSGALHIPGEGDVAAIIIEWSLN